MSKEINFVQCKLVKGDTHQVTFIPEKFAIQNQIVKLKNEDDTWDNGWVVTEIYSKVNEETARILQRVWTKTRQTSDI